MRSLAFAMAIIAGAIPFPGAQAAHTKAFQSGPWDGTVYYHGDSDSISLCAARKHFANGFSLSIALEPGGGYALAFVSPGGFSNAGVHYGLYAGAKLIHSGHAMPEKGGQLFRLDGPKGSLENLERGTSLRVSLNYGEASFSLKGSAEAIEELRRCVTGHGISASASGKDQSRLTARNEEAGTPQVVSRERLIPYATEILRNAGLTGYRFLPQGKDEKTANALTWQFEDGSAGSLAAVEKAQSLDLDRYIGEITAADTARCKGEFANGKRAPDFHNGAEIRKVFGSCDEGLRSFYVEYALVRMPDGFLVKLTSLKSGSNTISSKEGPGLQSDRERVTRTEESTLATLSRN